MKFDYERWKAAVLASGDPTIGADGLLEAGGLIDADYLEDDIAFLMAQIVADLDEAEREGAKKTPLGPPASS